MTKRTFDVLFAGVSLLVLGLPMLAVALAIKLSSEGPVFYRQRRIGRGGKPFWLYKFRSMRPCQPGPEVTADGDPRVTPIGRFLRRTKIDELPQLWNVLRGDMSVIGPRPEVERFVRHYTAEQRQVLEQSPGLAGLSQLVYPHEAKLLRDCDNSEKTYLQQLMPRKLAVDLEYERTRTLWSDMRLLVEIAALILGSSKRIDRNFRIQSPPEDDTAAGQDEGFDKPVGAAHLHTTAEGTT